MTAQFVGCNPGDALDASTPKFYRLTFTPSGSISAALFSDEGWTTACARLVDELSATPLFAAQGAPTVILSPSYSAVIDTMARTSAAGATVQSAFDSVNGMDFTIDLVSIQCLTPSNSGAPNTVGPANQPAQEATAATSVATAGAANSLSAELESIGKYLLIALVLVAVIAVSKDL